MNNSFSGAESSKSVNFGKYAKLVLSGFGIILVLFIVWKFQQNNIDSLDGKIRIYETKIIKASNGDERLKLEKDILGFEKDKTTIQNGAYTTLVQALGGLILSITAWVGYQNFRIGEKNLKVAEDKQVNERFSKSIEHLGHDKIDIRLGGIYALEQIAIDSSKYHWTIVEILSAYIREKSPIDNQLRNLSDTYSQKVTIDIQAALIVLGRRKIEQDPQGKKIDLRRANLPKVQIPQAKLSGANLTEANLREANLVGATLREADLRKAHLSGADLRGVNLLHLKNLTQEQIDSAIIDNDTKLPPDLNLNLRNSSE
jgi:Pentapeptide repeats (8 copies)